jgi:hypothetical protein
VTAISQIRGTAARSPLVKRWAQRSMALPIHYQWQNYSVQLLHKPYWILLTDGRGR